MMKPPEIKPAYEARAQQWARRRWSLGLCAWMCLPLPAWPSTGPGQMETVRVGQLYIDRSEVTIAQFAHYTAATGIRTQAEQTGGGFEYEAGWQKRPGWYWRAPDGQTDADPRLPAVHITHTEAAAYCQWRQGRLPTAQEWLNAAFTEQRSQPSQGLQTGRTYPWPTGDSPHGANTVDNKTWPRAAPAGATQAGVNGLYDMGANVWEWVADSRQGESRTMGGSWWYGSYQMRAEVQAWKPSDFYAVYIGFRCVYDAKPGLGIAGPKSGFM